jgi:glutamate synthase (NADPH/NADH) small chain
MVAPALGPPIAEPLSQLDVLLEANRCLYCYDAPCIAACPTGIDIPAFIKKIASGNLLGSARTIMEANPLGASCARVCPTGELCEGACVYKHDAAPIRIGALQRHATDWLAASGTRLFSAGPATGKRVAIVGGGPAGLAAARDLARLGHAVTIFEADGELGGLNTYGIVPFRLPVDVARWEARQVVELGVEVRTGSRVGIGAEANVAADSLLREFDAVVLAAGMASVPRLGILGEDLHGVEDALDVIERAKFGRPVTLGARVAVIGAGNTAIDAATVARRLGAEDVTIWYRRGPAEMTAYGFEVAFARAEGIAFKFARVPVRIEGEDGTVTAIVFAQSELIDGVPRAVAGTEERVAITSVIRAIGQSKHLALFDSFGVAHEGGVPVVDAELRTNAPRVYAAGDCIFRADKTDAMVVVAAKQGKDVAASIDRDLRNEAGLDEAGLNEGSRLETRRNEALRNEALRNEALRNEALPTEGGGDLTGEAP